MSKKISADTLKAILSSCMVLLMGIMPLAAQSTEGIVGSAADGDFLRSIGKIYIVVAVIVTIFIGIIIFMISMERRLAKLEKQADEL